MKIKTIILTALLSIGFPLAAKAETGTELKTLSFCDAECSQLNLSQTNNFPVQLAEEENEVAQRTRTRIRRTSRGSDLKRFYLGGTLGLYFPGTFDDFPEIVVDDGDSEPIDFGTGFGASLYGGYKFNSLIGADLEFILFGGGADPLDDSVYGSAGVFLNPRFTYAFNRDNVNKSPYVFLSPGLGVVSVGFGEDLETRLDINDIDTSGSGLALQLKAGVGFGLSETIDIFGQARYFTAFNVYSEDDIPDRFDADDQNFSSFGLELGLNFKI